jgi:hypothetical protein
MIYFPASKKRKSLLAAGTRLTNEKGPPVFGN